jgi:hypothetical protein
MALALPHLLHGKETRVWGDQAYRGQIEVMRSAAARAPAIFLCPLPTHCSH